MTTIPFSELNNGAQFTSEQLHMRYPPFTKVDEIHFVDAKGKTWLAASSTMPVKGQLGFCDQCGPAGPQQKISADMTCTECKSCPHNCSGAHFGGPCQWDPDALTKEYKSQAARDAQASRYGNRSYWDHLDESAQRHYDYFVAHGDTETAASMFTRTLSESLMGNDGD